MATQMKTYVLQRTTMQVNLDRGDTDKSTKEKVLRKVRLKPGSEVDLTKEEFDRFNTGNVFVSKTSKKVFDWSVLDTTKRDDLDALLEGKGRRQLSLALAYEVDNKDRDVFTTSIMKALSLAGG